MRCSKPGHRYVTFNWNEECPVCSGSMPPSNAPKQDSASEGGIASETPEEAAQEPQSDFSGMPGSALAYLIPEWAVNDTKGCSCKSWEKKMNKHGIGWCKANRDAIVEHLVASKKYLSGPMKSAPDFIARAGSKVLLSTAIKMADRKKR